MIQRLFSIFPSCQLNAKVVPVGTAADAVAAGDAFTFLFDFRRRKNKNNSSKPRMAIGRMNFIRLEY
jgi:hypothetical protein